MNDNLQLLFVFMGKRKLLQTFSQQSVAGGKDMPEFVSNQSFVYIAIGFALGHETKRGIAKGKSGGGKTYLLESLKKPTIPCKYL